MVKSLLTICAAAVALCGMNVYAQADKPGEDKAAPSKPATKAEKEAARKKRMATSKEISEGKGSTSSDNTVRTGKKATAEEKAAARAKRQAEGKEVSKKGSSGTTN